MTAPQDSQRVILIACGDLDLLRRLASDLPPNTYKPMATRKGKGIVKKLGSREIALAIVHNDLEDDYAHQLLAELQQFNPNLPILFLTADTPPKIGSFNAALRYPMPGPVLRNAIKQLVQQQNSDQDLEKWRLFYRELKARLSAADEQNYFQLLGLSQGAPHYKVVKAFDILSLRYHPDRYHQFCDEKWGKAIYDLTNRLYKLISEAYHVIGDRRLLARYEDVLAQGQLRLDPSEVLASTNQTPKTLVDLAQQAPAKKFLRLAQMDLAKQDFASALQNLNFALSMEPNNSAIIDKIRELQNLSTATET